MMLLATVWWVAFLAALGLCVGSFLNVVIFRLPLGLSVFEPKWSFCPSCEQRIRWYDNLPVISYLRLRGRCRFCGQPIAVRYLVVEVLTVLVVMVLFDAFFVSQTRGGLPLAADLNWRILESWPVYTAHVALFACLIAMSAIDLQHYWVDVRFTWMATAAGVALHTIWTPGRGDSWDRPGAATSAVCLAATISAALAWIVQLLRAPRVVHQAEPEDAIQDKSIAISMAPEHGNVPAPAVAEAAAGQLGGNELVSTEAGCAVGVPQPETRLVRRAMPTAWLVAAIGLACIAWVTAGAMRERPFWPHVDTIAVTLLGFFIIVAAGAQHRPADVEIVETIEQERHTARGVVAVEALWLMPAVVAGLLVWLLVVCDPDRMAAVEQMLDWRPIRDWRPMRGLATALTGLILAGALGWAVRIGFTILLGKEALGTGDIHMMAAAGCVAGWQVVVIGFFASALIALAGWVMLFPLKRSHAIPYGPWLSLSFLLVCLLYEPIMGSHVISSIEFVVTTLLVSPSGR